MPFPKNLETAVSVESIIRKHGAVPATIGCLNGRLHVGMTVNEIEVLAKTSSATKISRRDFAVVAARGLTGGTTIAGTMILAHKTGIKVFATGVYFVFRIYADKGIGWCSPGRRIMYVLH
jgi:pseudouridine-5'-phosphate glycosidase